MTAPSTVLPPPVAPATALSPALLPPLPLPPPPAAVSAPVPGRVRATTHVGGLPLEVLMGCDGRAPSVLDVDPRLLDVRRAAPRPAAVAQRSLAAPDDLGGDQQNRRRHVVYAVTSGVAAAAASVLAVALALG